MWNALTEEEMALTQPDKKWIEEQIRDTHASKGWKFARILRDWGILGACITGALSMVAISITLGVFAASEIRQNSEFRGRTGARLDAIEANQRKSAALESPGKVFQEIAALDPKAFAINLPALRTVAERPSAEVNPSQSLLHNVAVKLGNTSEASPEYWPTALQFVHFGTSALSPDAPPPGPPWYLYLTGGEWNTFQGNYEKQAFFIGDGPTIFRDSVFVKCRIVIGPNVVLQLKNVTFVDCVFDFPTNGEATPVVRQIAKSLLAMGLSRVWVSSA